MAWPKGKTRPENSGRKKGTRNKRTSEVAQILEEKNFDLIQEIINLYQRTCLDEYTGGVAATCLKILAPMVYPSLKQVEVSTTQLRRLEIEVHDGRIYSLGTSEITQETE